MQDVVSETIRLLQDRKGSLPTVAEETGLGYWWLRKLADNQIAEPGYNKIQTLYAYLTDSTQAA